MGVDLFTGGRLNGFLRDGIALDLPGLRGGADGTTGRLAAQVETTPEAYGADDSVSGATVISAMPFSRRGDIGGGDTDDWWSFTATETGNLTVNMTGLSSDIDLYLYNGALGIVDASYNGGTASEQVTYRVTMGQTYYLRVNAYDNAAATSYTLSGSLVDNDNSRANAGYIFVPGTVEGRAGGSDTVDWIEISPLQSGNMSISLSDMSSNLNLGLYDANGVLLSSSANAGSADESLNYTVVANTTYYIKIDGSAGANSHYTLTTQVGDGNDSVYQAVELDLPDNLDSTIGGSDEDDWYIFTADQSGTILIGITGLASDIDLALYDGDGYLATYSTQDGTASEYVSYDVTPGETYYVLVTAYNGAEETDYSLTAGYAEDDDSLDGATLIELPEGMSGTVGNIDAVDWYGFTAAEDGTLTVDTSGLPAAMDLLLYDGDGDLISWGNDLKDLSYAVEQGEDYYLAFFPYYADTVYSYDVTAYVVDADNFMGAGYVYESPVARTGVVGASDSDDWITISPSDDGTFHVRLSGLSDDASIEVYDFTGDLVASSDRAGTQTETISIDDTYGWDYYFVRVHYDGDAAQVDYTLDAWTVDTDNSQADATDITGDRTTEGSVGGDDTSDWYVLTAESTETLVVTLADLSSDIALRIMDADGNLLGSASGGTGDREYGWAVEAGETVYVELRATDGAARTSYSLVTSYIDENDTPDAATAADMPLVITGEVGAAAEGFSDREDWFEVVAPESGNLVFWLWVDNFDAALTLEDADGNTLRIADTGGAYNEYLEFEVTAGATYRIGVSTAIVRDPGDYELHTFYTDVARDYVHPGTEQADSLPASNYNDLVLAFGGDDTIRGTRGADTIDGGDGFDIIDFHDATEAVAFNMATNYRSGSFVEGDVISSVEGIYGSNHNDRFVGTSGANDIRGSAGDDIIAGGAGNDTLYGGDGADDLDGGVGNDFLSGDAGADRINGGGSNDWLSYEGSDEAVSLTLRAGTWATGSGGDADGDRVINIENINGSNFDDSLGGDIRDNHITGGDGNDTLYGNLGRDTLEGGAGDDEIRGNYTADWLSGGDGDDGVFGGYGNDTVLGGAGNDTLLGERDSDILYGGAGDDLIGGGTEADTLYGNSGNDTLRASEGNDWLEGGAGNDSMDGGRGSDTLIGNSGDDIMTGGGEPDTFIFADGDGNDTITDFQVGRDRLDLSDTEIDFTSLDDLVAHTSTSTVDGVSGLLIETGDGDSIFLQGLNTNHLAGMDIDY
ncbi:MAG: hypothetical protein EP335_10095 [Alphaproteobacteria bacterium]|nr:MAG: hypothetical protein EP335_10095 [Alphaproteobacteria bacterium]